MSDSSRPAVGVVFPPKFEPEALLGYAPEAESAGLDELWLWEDCFREGGVATVAAALAVTERIRVAIGVFPMPLRNVALTAMEVASIDRMFPGRFLLGVGHGAQHWMGQVGARVASPLTLMREYVPALRALLAGEELTVSGRYVTLDAVRLDWPPAAPVPLHAAGEGAKTLALTGELADGTVFVPGCAPSVILEARERIEEGRALAGRTGPHAISVFIMTAFARTEAETAAGRAWFEAKWARDGIAPDRRGGVLGTPAEVAEQLRAYADAGVTNLVMLPGSDVDRSAFLAAAGETAELLRAGA